MIRLNENRQWIIQEIDHLINQEPQYENRAFLIGLKNLIHEQVVRSDQMQGEIDGRLWDHVNW